MGSTDAKNHLGVLPKPDEQVVSGPVYFKGRYDGNKGWIYISTTSATPTLSFSRTNSESRKSPEHPDALFSIPIEDITEIKKVGGLGWKAKIVVGWATNRNVADGLEITNRDGKTWRLTAIPLKDELFNRLVAMSGQKWESW